MKGSSYVKAGISFGTALAMVISYVNWHSVLWAAFHGLLGWFYVIYYVLFYGWQCPGGGNTAFYGPDTSSINRTGLYARIPSVSYAGLA